MDFKKRAFSSRFRKYFLDIITCFLVLILSRSRRKIFVNKHIVCGQHFVNKQIYERLFVKYFRWLAFFQSPKYGTHFFWPSLAHDYHSNLLSLWLFLYILSFKAIECLSVCVSVRLSAFLGWLTPKFVGSYHSVQ